MMNLFNDAIRTGVERLGWTLLHFVWQATVAVFITAIVLRFLNRASAGARYIALCAALFVTAAMPVATFVGLSGDVRVAADQESDAWETDASANETATAMERPLSVAHPDTDSPTGPDHPLFKADGIPSEPKVTHATSASTPFPVRVREPSAEPDEAGLVSPRVRARIVAALPWVVTTWMVGVALLAIWHAVGWGMLSRLKREHTKPPSAAIQALFSRLANEMGIRSALRLLESAATSVPIVVGWIRPVLLIPASSLTGLSQEQLKAILAHELAHVRRHDVLVNLLQTIVETLLFYHPAVWWLSRRIRIEREYCADDVATEICQNKESYAKALVTLAESAMSTPRSATASTGGALTHRIKRLLGLARDRERLIPRPAGAAVLAVLGLAVICCFLASPQTIAQPREEPGTIVTPIDELAKKLPTKLSPETGEPSASDDPRRWKLQEADSRPSVRADGFQGYRIVLRRTWKEYIGPHRQQRASARPSQQAETTIPPEHLRLRHEDWEFVLIPVEPRKAPIELKSRIKWRKSNSPYHTRDICLGEGHGYMWFTHGTLFNQEFVREKFKLDDGDDRLQLAADGLKVDDKGTMTANSCQHILARFGDRALPYIQTVIGESREKSPDVAWKAGTTLSYIHTPRATSMIEQLMESRTKIVRQAAVYALATEPFRKEAKKSYLEILRSGEYGVDRTAQACKASVKFHWTEAIPLIRELETKPLHVRDYAVLVRARRALEGNPIGEDLIKAERTLLRLVGAKHPLESEPSIAAARKRLIDSEDAEAANLAALSLAVFVTKGNSELVNQMGIEILRARPRKETLEFLKSLAERIRDADHRQVVENVIKAVN